MAFGKLWSLHLNDQNGLKFDQDKPFGSTNLRVAFNQVRALERNGYGKAGEYVCFDVHPFRTTRVEHWLAHLNNSRRTFLKLVAKARTFDERKAQQLIAERNYQDLDQMVNTFFTEIGVVLEQRASTEDDKERAQAWKAWGSRINFMPASSGIWFPLRRLHVWHAATRFSHVEAPPRERGTT